MATSFVIFAPERERKKLRDCGVLPARFFGDIDRQDEEGAPFCFWPHELDYAAGDELAKTVREHPVHIPEFFGLKGTADAEARDLATDRVVKVLKSVAVHIVFLDNEIDSEREDYVSFRSFADLTAWSANLNEVLHVAFAQNRTLAAPQNVLVLVARGAGIKVTQDELDAFSSQVGEGRTFRSCYFLDYHLAIGGRNDYIPSREVWELMIARLLHAFYLSCDHRTERPINPFWMAPGIKVWRASECVFSVDDKKADATRRWVRSWVYDNICNRLTQVDVPGGFLGALGETEAPHADKPVGTIGFSPADDWLTVDPARYKRTVEDPKRAKKRIEVLADGLSKARVQQRSNGGQGAASEIFGRIHKDAGSVHPSLVATNGEISRRQKELKNFRPEEDWKRVAEVNRHLRQMIDDMNSGREFNVLKRHYIGWKLGFAVLVAVVSGYGLFAYLLLSKVLGAAIFYSILAGASVSVGAFTMLAVILHSHNRAGRRVVKGLYDYCQTIERLTGERDDCIRNSIYRGLRRHMLFNQLACGARIKSLLLRLIAMLETELQGNDAIGGGDQPEVSAPESVLHARFRKSSRHEVTYVPGLSVFEKGKIDAIVKEIWNGRNFGSDFSRLWRQLCRADIAKAGHFPAVSFVSALRHFSSTIVEAVYAEAIDRSIDPDSERTLRAYREWVDETKGQNFYAAFSAEINAAVVYPNDRRQSVFCLPRLESVVRRVIEAASLRLSTYPVDRILDENGTMALAYEEAVVEMAIDADTGLVGLVEAKGANRA